jgi:hypothetical protein
VVVNVASVFVSGAGVGVGTGVLVGMAVRAAITRAFTFDSISMVGTGKTSVVDATFEKSLATPVS